MLFCQYLKWIYFNIYFEDFFWLYLVYSFLCGLSFCAFASLILFLGIHMLLYMPTNLSVFCPLQSIFLEITKYWENDHWTWCLRSWVSFPEASDSHFCFKYNFLWNYPFFWMLFPLNIGSYLLITTVNQLIFYISDYIFYCSYFVITAQYCCSFLPMFFENLIKLTGFTVSSASSVARCSQYVSRTHWAVLTWLLYFLNSSSSLLPPNPVFWTISLFLLSAAW